MVSVDRDQPEAANALCSLPHSRGSVRVGGKLARILTFAPSLSLPRKRGSEL